jgi:general secretion pathway protein C
MIIAHMVSNLQNKWAVAGATFAVWGLLAASTVYWGLKLTAPPAAPTAATLPVRAPAPADPVAVARLLGASPVTAVAAPTPSIASRFALLGVVASSSQKGAALIAVDGKPPKPYRVGAEVEEGIVLQSVESRRAVLAGTDGVPVLTLDLPPRK